ncbi:MAG: MFS transporter [Pyrinomonadaceae bacterium]
MPDDKTTVISSAAPLKILLHFGFLVSGIVTILTGQILPILSARLRLNDEQAGYFFTVQFTGSLIGTFLTQTFAKRIGFAGVTIFGCLAMAAGVLFLNSEIWLVCQSAFFVMGFGIGITLPAINMLTVELNPLNATSALNFLNFFWGIGAIICKPFVDFFGTRTSIFQPTIILAVLLLAIGLAILFVPREKEQAQFFAENEPKNLIPIWTTLTAWLITLFNFIHVGFESGAGGWITTYANRFPSETRFFWLSPTLAYFFFFVTGRGVAPIFSRFLSENKMLLVSLLILTLGVLILVSGNGFWILILGASIAGFGTSSIFPTNMARFTKTFGATATRRATPLFVSGTLGAALITQLIGYFSTNYGSLRVGMYVLLASCLSLIVLQIALSFNSKIRF